MCAPTPAIGCRLAAAGGSTFKIKDSATDVKDQLKWKWSKGAATDLTDFANPVTGAATYRVCVYDGSANPQPLAQMDVPPGGTCGTKPCWKAAQTKGFAYKNKLATPDGIVVLKLKTGVAGKAKVLATAKGEPLPTPSLPLTLPITVQLVIQDGLTSRCWQTTYTTFKVNEGVLFSAKGP